MVLVDARGLPVAVDTTSASPNECRLVQRLFEFMLTEETPERVIGEKAYDIVRLRLGRFGFTGCMSSRSKQRRKDG